MMVQRYRLDRHLCVSAVVSVKVEAKGIVLEEWNEEFGITVW